MSTYQIFVDLPIDGNWDNIEVDTFEVEAINISQAYRIAQEQAKHNYEKFYVWEVTECDKISE